MTPDITTNWDNVSNLIEYMITIYVSQGKKKFIEFIINQEKLYNHTLKTVIRPVLWGEQYNINDKLGAFIMHTYDSISEAIWRGSKKKGKIFEGMMRTLSRSEVWDNVTMVISECKTSYRENFLMDFLVEYKPHVVMKDDYTRNTKMTEVLLHLMVHGKFTIDNFTPELLTIFTNVKNSIYRQDYEKLPIVLQTAFI